MKHYNTHKQTTTTARYSRNPSTHTGPERDDNIYAHPGTQVGNISDQGKPTFLLVSYDNPIRLPPLHPPRAPDTALFPAPTSRLPPRPTLTPMGLQTALVLPWCPLPPAGTLAPPAGFQRLVGMFLVAVAAVGALTGLLETLQLADKVVVVAAVVLRVPYTNRLRRSRAVSIALRSSYHLHRPQPKQRRQEKKRYNRLRAGEEWFHCAV